MRDLLAYRDVAALRQCTEKVKAHFGGFGDSGCGVFLVLSPIDRAPMFCIASNGEGWDHVSVSRRNRCPNWPELEHVRHLFFEDDETVMQLHVPTAQHINNHATCLHLWRPQHVAIPLPPAEFV